MSALGVCDDIAVRVLVATDRYAALLDAARAAAAISLGWAAGAPHDDLDTLALTDGGHGFLDAVAAAAVSDAHPAAASHSPAGRRCASGAHPAGRIRLPARIQEPGRIRRAGRIRGAGRIRRSRRSGHSVRRTVPGPKWSSRPIRGDASCPPRSC
ncbi:MAG: glycerate kinase [Actinomycetales bacterium]|nr:glycerate kinase [Actinomycetales bacterium]